MKLWTIQTEEAWRYLNQRGYLRCRRSDADRDFLPAYDWMAAQMTSRIGRSASGATLPLWAWLQYAGVKRKRPDLRRSAHLPRGTRGFRIEFTVDEDAVLVSDFELWHYVLNYWYLPRSEHDDIDFDSRHERPTYSWSDRPEHAVDDEIRGSWVRIFDINNIDEYVTCPPENKSLQSTLWQLDLTQVTTVDEFVAR